VADNFFQANRGINLLPQGTVPNNPRNGDLYYDSVLNKFKKYENGTLSDLAGSVGTSYPITAGEALVAGQAIYISAGVTDSGRTAGLAYKLDVTQSTRYVYAGFVVASIAQGVLGTAQVGGLMSNFTGLTPSTILYGSVSNPGDTQSTIPTAGAGIYVVPVAVAVSASDILIAPPLTSSVSLAPTKNGSTNYILNSDAEVNTLGYALYANTAQATPVSGVGGFASLGFGQTNTSLRGAKSFVLTKPTGNRQGRGVAYTFTIEAADQGKSLNIQFDYSASPGFVPGNSSDLQVFIYDITNNALVVVAPSTIQTQKGTFKGLFQTAANGSQYRLILHVATTNAATWLFTFDNVVVGTSIGGGGTTIASTTDWTSFNGTCSWLNVNISAKYRRVGDTAEISYTLTGTSSSSGTSLALGLPPGLAIDTNKLSGLTNFLGTGNASQQSYGNTNPLFAVYYSTTQVSILKYQNTNFDLTSTGVNSFPFGFFGTGASLEIWFEAPIAGWNSAFIPLNTNFDITAADGASLVHNPAGTDNVVLGSLTGSTTVAGSFTANGGVLASSPIAGLSLLSGNAANVATISNVAGSNTQTFTIGGANGNGMVLISNTLSGAAGVAFYAYPDIISVLNVGNTEYVNGATPATGQTGLTYNSSSGTLTVYNNTAINNAPYQITAIGT
jgi:hypothetical protein